MTALGRTPYAEHKGRFPLQLAYVSHPITPVHCTVCVIIITVTVTVTVTAYGAVTVTVLGWRSSTT